MREGEFGGVQEHAAEGYAERAACDRLVEFEVSVLVVAHKRMAGGQRMHANLVGAARFEFDVKVTDPPVALQKREDRVGGEALLRNAHAPLARRQEVALKRELDVLPIVHPVALDERQVVLLDPALFHEVVHAHERLAGLRDDQSAARFLVETMTEFERHFVGARRAQALDQPVTNARAPVGGKARGLQNDKEMPVFEENGESVRREGRGGRFGDGAVAHPHGRNAHEVARRQFRLRVDALFVDAHFAPADHAVDVALRHALRQAEEKVVETLSVRILADHNERDPVGGKSAQRPRGHGGNFVDGIGRHRLYFSILC